MVSNVESAVPDESVRTAGVAGSFSLSLGTVAAVIAVWRKPDDESDVVGLDV